MVSYRLVVARRWRLAAIVGACVAVGALVAALLLPQLVSNAANTGVSSVWVTGTNQADGSKAASSDAPGGLKTGTAKPGDTVKWVVPYQNKTSGAASVDLRANITGGSYVQGSLQLPPNANPSGSLSPQYSTDGGSTWANGTAPANATGVGFSGVSTPSGNQQLSGKFQTAPSQTVQTTGGDSYNVVVRNGLIYGVFHHARVDSPSVYCMKMDGTTCPGWPTNSIAQPWSDVVGTRIGAAVGLPGWTAWENGTWISGNKMFWFVQMWGSSSFPNDSIGTACLDLSTTTPTSCGFTRFGSGVGFATTGANGALIGSTGMTASDGNIWAVAQFMTGPVLFCVSPATGGTCGMVSLNTSAVGGNSMTSAVFGKYVFASVPSPNAPWKTYCYLIGSGFCPGSWPVSTSPASANGGTPFGPVLDTSGTLKGICSIKNGANTSTACWDLSGSPTGIVYSSYTANYTAPGYATGDMLVVGNKVYSAWGNYVYCNDFARYSGSGWITSCLDWWGPPNGNNYTVRPASDVSPNCLVAAGDSGQITFFNAISGRGCSATSAPTSVTVTPSTYYCGSGSAGFKGWGALTLPGLVAGTYSNSTVTLRDQNDNVISGFNGVTLAAGGSLNLTSIPTTVTSITASVVVNGVNDEQGLTGGQVSITWSGDPIEMCFQTKAAEVSCDAAAPVRMYIVAKSVTSGTSGQTDAPNGNVSGGDGSASNQAAFLIQAPPSECRLKIKKSLVGGSPSVDMGDKVQYAITIQNTGTHAYDKAAYTDDLTDVLKEATYNGDQTATKGTVSYAAPVLSWLGALAPQELATVTYSVTVKNPAKGDHSLVNTVVSSSPNNNCAAGSSDPDCTVVVTVKSKEVTWHKVDPSKNILTGSEWSFTPVDGSGNPTGTALAVTDCVAALATSCTGADKDPLGGVFRLTDLGVGTYKLVETKAPIGFKLDSTPITVTITSAVTTVAVADVVNKQLPVPAIPFTGGLGTDLLTFTGAGLFALVVVLGGFQRIRRRRAA